MPARMLAETGAPPLQRRERRPVALSATATRGDGSVVEMTIVDFSHDGCGVQCVARLHEGEPLNLAVLKRGAINAEVRWASERRAGLCFTSKPEPKRSASQPRGYERVSVEGEVAMRRAGKLNFRVRIYDISPDGCKAEFVDRPDLGEQLWVKFDGMEALEADVRWIVAAKAGLKFARPIHAAVFDMLLSRLGARP